MKKVYRLKNLDCANCAAKLERAVQKIDGVRGASVSFMTLRLAVEADEERFAQVMEQVVRVCRRVAPDCGIEL